jgi:small subunit ribosomal protein S1
MSAHHVDSPEQVVTPGEELWVKIIDLDLQRRRISLSIKQAAEGGELAPEYSEHFEVDDEGNWAASEEVEAAWAEFESADAGEAGAEGGEATAESTDTESTDAEATDAAPADESTDAAPADESTEAADTTESDEA